MNWVEKILDNEEEKFKAICKSHVDGYKFHSGGDKYSELSEEDMKTFCNEFIRGFKYDNLSFPDNGITYLGNRYTYTNIYSLIFNLRHMFIEGGNKRFKIITIYMSPNKMYTVEIWKKES